MTREERKRELIALIEVEKRLYLSRIEPYIQALIKIQESELPLPMVLPDGRVFQYIGPLPSWDGEDSK